MDWLMANIGWILGILLAVSEAMAMIPVFEGNGILDAVIKFLKKIKEGLGK